MNCTNCCGEQPSCRRALFQIGLRMKTTGLPSDAYNNGNFILKYSELEMNIETITGQNGLTSLNSIVCPNPAVFGVNDGASYSLVSNEATDITTLRASSTFLEPSEVGPVIQFTNYNAGLLFTIVVDYFPGEINDGSGVIVGDCNYVNSMNDQGCSFFSASLNGSVPDPYPFPSGGTNFNFRLSMATPVCTPTKTTFPVNLFIEPGVSPNASYLDFVIVLLTNGAALVSPPKFIPSFGSPTITTVVLPNNMGYNFLVRYESLSLSTGTNPLFNIEAEPLNLSNGFGFTASVLPGRVITSAGCQKVSTQSTSQTCTGSTPVPLCTPPNYQLSVVPFSPFQPGPCPTDYNYKVTITLDNYGNTTTFTSTRIQVDFELDAGLTISSATFSGNSQPTISGNSILFNAANVSWTNNDFITVTFTGTSNGCIKNALVRRVELMPSGSSTFCQASVYSENFPACKGDISGHIATKEHCFVSNVTVNFTPTNSQTCFPSSTPTDCSQSQQGLPMPNYQQCMCPGAGTWVVRPYKNDDLYEGLPENPNNPETAPLSEADIFSIQLHILGLIPFGPYDIIAADATMDGIVSSFDKVELRNLLQGKYDIDNPWPLEYAPSWRFVPKSYQFPKLENPFDPMFPEEIEVNLPASDVDFVAIKIGSMLDVSNNVLPFAICQGCFAPKPAKANPDFAISSPILGAKKGQSITVPIRANSDIPLAAWQMGIQFDHNALAFTGLTYGDIGNMDENNFNTFNALTTGKIRASWDMDFSVPDRFVQKGDVLFYLHFDTKRTMYEGEDLVKMDNKVMGCSGWTMDLSRYPLVNDELTRGVFARNEQEGISDFAVNAHPNPTSSDFLLDVYAPQSEDITLFVTDALGRRVLNKSITVFEGLQSIQVRESIEWPSGLYFWNIINSSSHIAQGQVIKQ